MISDTPVPPRPLARPGDAAGGKPAKSPWRVAFHAPMKSPDHPAPSGDRLMARQIVAALRAGGHRVEISSIMRSYLRDPADRPGQATALATAASEIARLDAEWREGGPPDLWLCYHPYYKSPDLIGPALCAAHDVPMVTVEASLSARRATGVWTDWQARAAASVRAAAVNICLTARDEAGLHEMAPGVRTARLPPFIDAAPLLARPPRPEPGRLVSVAMMRPGDKLESYRLMAAALARLDDLPWRLTLVGDGPARGAVEALFAPLPPGRIDWAGQLPPEGVAAVLAGGAAFVWPGTGEAYGLAYLEAQAAGLPVVAQRCAGVPEVVADGETGLLTAPGEAEALAGAIHRLLTEPGLRERLAEGARRRVVARHSFDAAALRLEAVIAEHLRSPT